MSAALKRPPEPTPFPSAERGRLGHAIAAAAHAVARRVALEKAIQSATAEVRAARAAVEAAEAAVEAAKSNAVAHARDQAMGTAGDAPVSIRDARAALTEAQDRLETAREAREALIAEQAAEAERPGYAADRVSDCVKAVIRAEMQHRSARLAVRVAEMQRQLLEVGSGLHWLAAAGVFPTIENGPFRGCPADDGVRHTVQRLDSAPRTWENILMQHEAPFAVPVGAQRWQAAFEALQRDATTALPED